MFSPEAAFARPSLTGRSRLITLGLTVAVVASSFLGRYDAEVLGFRVRVEQVVPLILAAWMVAHPALRSAFARTLRHPVPLVFLAFVAWNVVTTLIFSPSLTWSASILVWLLIDLLLLMSMMTVAEGADVVAGLGRVSVAPWALIGFAAYAVANLSRGQVAFGTDFDYLYEVYVARVTAIEANIYASILIFWTLLAATRRGIGRWETAAIAVSVPLGLVASQTRTAVFSLVLGLGVFTVCTLLSRRSSWRERLRRILPAAVLVAALVLTYAVVAALGGTAPADRTLPPTASPTAAASPTVADGTASPSPAPTREPDPTNPEQQNKIGDVDFQGGTIAFRVEVAGLAAQEMTGVNLWFGNGTNTFGLRHEQPGTPGVSGHIIMLPVQVLYDGGLVGLGLLVALFARSSRACLARASRSPRVCSPRTCCRPPSRACSGSRSRGSSSPCCCGPSPKTNVTSTAPEQPRPHRARSVALLTGVSALSAISPLIALPLITRAAGPTGFAEIAIGQALGTLAATLITFGWAVRGPVEAARSSHPSRVFRASIVVRGANSVVMLPLVALVAALASHADDHALAVVSALAFSLQGLSLSWYAVGVGRPLLSLVFDAVPRIVLNLAGAVLALATGIPLLYPLVLLIGTLAAVVVATWLIGLRERFSMRTALADARSAYRGGWRTALAAGLLTFSETAPLSTLGVATSSAAVGFAPFDRVLKYGYIGVYMITSSFQGWVSSASGEAGLRRMRRAVGIHALLAMGLGAGFALVVPWATPIVLGPGFEIAPLTALFGGVALAAMTLATALGMCVVLPRGRDGRYLGAVCVGAVLIVPAVLIGAGAAGIAGAAAGVASVQVAVLTALAMTAVPVLRGR